MFTASNDHIPSKGYNRLHQKLFGVSAKEKKVSLKERLKVWFKFWLANCHQRCEECKAPIHRYDEDGLYASQAHIVPKKIFHSVCDVIENHMTLGSRCGCHSRFDKSWASAMAMKVWPTAVERFKTFAHKIPIEEARHLPDELRQYCSV